MTRPVQQKGVRGAQDSPPPACGPGWGHCGSGDCSIVVSVHPVEVLHSPFQVVGFFSPAESCADPSQATENPRSSFLSLSSRKDTAEMAAAAPTQVGPQRVPLCCVGAANPSGF